MKNKIIIIVAIIFCSTTCFTACSQQSKEEIDSTKMVEKALLDELFNVTEKLIADIEKKDYVTATEKISKIYELSSKSGFTSADEFANSEKYFESLDLLTTAIEEQSNLQKLNKVYYEFEKSIIELAADASSKSEEGSGSEEGGGSDSEEKSEDSTEEESEETEGGTKEPKEEGGEDSKVIIVQEELLKQYPELITTLNDREIKNDVIVLLDYISQKILEMEPGEEQAAIKRQKVYFYSVASLADLAQFDSANQVIATAENDWDEFLLKNDSEDKSEIKTISTVVKNITEALSKKNAISVNIQKDIAIEVLDELSDKLISEKMKEES